VATTNDEAFEVVWLDPAELDGLQIHPTMRQRIEHFRQKRTAPYLG
jgi:hypothetical protein